MPRWLPRTPLQRFAEKCVFEAETGCVLWIGAKTWGRGKTIRYGGFRDENSDWWLAHRWAAKHIHGQKIAGLQVDHCCPNIPIPNTLCVEHTNPITDVLNRWLQTERRRHFVHLEVGLLPYEDVYGLPAEPDPDAMPFFEMPAWLKEFQNA